MNKQDKKKKIEKIVVENSSVSKSLPIFKGDAIYFDGDVDNFVEEVPEDERQHISAWTRINGVNGAISATQLLRKGNGIPLEGNDNTARLQNLLTNFTGDNDLEFTVFVKDVRERGEEPNVRRYYILDILAGEHKAEDFAKN